MHETNHQLYHQQRCVLRWLFCSHIGSNCSTTTLFAAKSADMLGISELILLNMLYFMLFVLLVIQIIERIRKEYTSLADFTPANAAKASSAAEGLCK